MTAERHTATKGIGAREHARRVPGPARILPVATIILLLAAPRSFGQQGKVHALPDELKNKCAMCHSCTAPTKSNPCLLPCPRVKESTGRYTPDDGPGLILMQRMKGKPVPFSHRAHAQMAEMSGGCFGCHHYNDTSLRILSCESCHPRERKRENLSIPDLSAAYHRRCLDCHRQWSGSPQCSACHLENTAGKTAAQILEGVTKGGKDHPQVSAPDRKVYQTKGEKGTVVTFYHSDHANRFGLACRDCHRQEGCVSCHDRRPPELRRKPASVTPEDFDARHARCSSCHANATCTTCHTATEAPRFDHGRTSGWALKSYHASLACSRCHQTRGKFTGLRNDCSTCHMAWTAETFKHSVTGLTLDELHGALDCTDCHPGREFGKPPVCSGCHPDKAYPQFKPGTAKGK